MGPGTHVINNVYNHKYPTSHTDALALQHDLNYLYSAGGDLDVADRVAIAQASDFGFQSNILKAGLTIRDFLGLDMSPFKDDSRHQARDAYEYIYSNDQWIDVMEKFGLKQYSDGWLVENNNEFIG
jgi:hypothetical protein